MGLIFAGLLALLIAGILVRRLATKALRHRPKIRVDRREPVLIENVAVKRPMPAPALLTPSPNLVPGHADIDDRIDEIEDALRRLAQRLRRRRLTPFKIIAPFVFSPPATSRVPR